VNSHPPQNNQPLPEEVEALRDEIVALKKELEETRKSTTQYLQNVAHQLTAPLNAIKWNIEAIKDEKVPIWRKKNLLSSIYSQGTILVHLIKNFSLMSNLEADHELGQFRDQPQEVSPLRLAINLAGDFAPQAAETSKKIDVLISTFDKVFAGKSLLVDKNLVAQALSNLLENGIKYSMVGTTIYVEAVCMTFKQTGESWKGICVRNTGLPILPQEIMKLTDRGFRGSAAKQKIPAGTGIGLYLASRVMDFHQGMVHAHAQGNETQITLLFPDQRIVSGEPLDEEP
jgi:signal transduction histidine kinase